MKKEGRKTEASEIVGKEGKKVLKQAQCKDLPTGNDRKTTVAAEKKGFFASV